MPNISFGRQEQLKRESLSVSEFLLDLRRRKPQVTLLILDACRDHPLVPPEQRSLSWGRGLARMDAPSGTFIMYSAAAGEAALDRLPKDDPDNVNSVYTRRLLPLLKTPGLSLPEMAQQLRREVHDIAASVPHVQRPAYYDGLIGKFCLAGCGSPPAPQIASSSPMVTPPDMALQDMPLVATDGAAPVGIDSLASLGVGTAALRTAARNGDALAQLEVATRFAEGDGVAQDHRLAFAWYERAAMRGLAAAQFRLAAYYERGVGVAIHSERAKIWYRRAAEQGHVRSMHNLAVLIVGSGKDDADYAAAAHWFQQAADRGLSDSHFNLAVLYAHGRGAPKT